jgi:hypothetical protein
MFYGSQHVIENISNKRKELIPLLDTFAKQILCKQPQIAEIKEGDILNFKMLARIVSLWRYSTTLV